MKTPSPNWLLAFGLVVVVYVFARVVWCMHVTRQRPKFYLPAPTQLLSSSLRPDKLTLTTTQGMRERQQRHSHLGRNSHPLAEVPTPFYLRRFSYVHSGQLRVFDEAAHGMVLPAEEATSSKRAPALDADGPAPKRREREDQDAADQDFADHSNQPHSEHSQAARRDTTESEMDEDFPTTRETPPASGVPVFPYAEARGPTQAMPALSVAAPASPFVPNQPRARTLAMGVPETEEESTDQPALLSPTASPLGSPSEDDRENASPVLTPGTAGPPSAAALTPLPVQTHHAASAGSDIMAAGMVPGSDGAHSGVANYAVESAPGLSGFGGFGGLSENQSPEIPRLLMPRLPYAPEVTLHDAALRSHLTALGVAFREVPSALQRYAMFNLLRMCDRSTMSALYGEMEAALRFDIVGNLPPELSSIVLRQLDCTSVFSASRVCRNWYRLVDSDDAVWQQLAVDEGLHPTRKDVDTARVERWGYTGWATLRNWPAVPPTNLFGKPVNVHKALFRRLMLIHQNWMRPDVAPRRYMIRCPDREVITCLDFSDDIIIASTEARHHLNVYDTQTGLLLHEFSDHDGGVWALKRVGLNTIITGSTDHTVRVWSLSKGRCTHVFRGHNATVRCLDVVMPADYVDPRSDDRPSDDPPPPSAVGESSYDFPLILTGSRDTTMRLWRLPNEDDADYDSKVAFVDRENPYFVGELRGHNESVRAVCGYGNVAVSGSYDYRVRVWDLATKKCRHELEGHENKVYAVIIDPERNRCISTSMDTQIIIWDLATGAPLYKLHGHTGLVGLVSLRDNTLVTAAADKTLREWDPETGALLHTLEGHNTAILCFVHDGRRIVSGSERHLKLWDTRTGEFRRDLLTGMDLIWQVSIDRRRCCAAVMRDRSSYLEVLDFDFDRHAPRPLNKQPQIEAYAQRQRRNGNRTW